MGYHKEKIWEFFMFAEYPLEIIALVVVVIVFIIYLVLKKKKDPLEHGFVDNKQEEKVAKKTMKPKMAYDEYDMNNPVDEYATDLEDIVEAPQEEPVQPSPTKVVVPPPHVENVSTPKKAEEVPAKKSVEVAKKHDIATKETVDVLEELEGKEEGSFGEEQIPQEQKKEVEKTEKITKREVPAHGKITKENFKEFAGSRILVAEDNIINQKVIKGLLADTGIEIKIADDGQIALDILEQDSDFFIILMDAHMPRVDGFEATRRIKANPAYDHIVVVALSGDTASDDVKKMKDAGMSEHLEKPLRMSALYDVLYAYSGENSPSNIIVTKELDTEKGLEVCGGDKEFYAEILNEFLNTYDNSNQDLGDYLNGGRLEEADKLLLDVIGLTANIGAEPLRQMANDIKVALNDTEEKSYLTLIDDYKTHLDNLIADIKAYR